NLLIYLNPTARQRVLETLDRMLAPQGVLCMGHAEPLEFLGTRYVRTGPQGFFLYQRRVPEPQQSPAVAYRAPLPKLPPPRAEAITLPPEAVDLLARARDLADKGQIDEALASCRANLSQSGSSAHLFTLMGVLHLARHEADEAQSCFQRALYLNPAHRDALTHLMLLCQEQGDLAQAARLRRRLDRVGSGGDA
ncbi:MAG TPA: hypothetical protein VGZ22_15675, partial [Isosphaeraceae bacterium]|nr:hypothetical protein [Isosphaeraceae bacterium]